MKHPMLLLLLLPLLIFAGCGDDSPTNPAAPGVDDFESQFPVNEDFAGEQTEFAKTEPTDDIVDTAIKAGFSTLVTAVQLAGFEETLRGEGPFTVFAPTNGAFDNLPEGLFDALVANPDKLGEILGYHVIAGAAVTSRDLRFFQRVETFEGSDLEILRFFRLILVNGIRVTTADIQATNGVIHVIKDVLVPPGFTLEDPPAPTLNLAELASAAGLTELFDAVVEAGLVDAVTGNDPLTVFAPTNDAFYALPEGLLDELKEDGNEALLQELLLYHVTGGQVLSTDLRRFQRVQMLAGGRSWVYKNRAGDVFINRSSVIAPDNLATNGVAHVIDRVLIPRSFYGVLHSLPATAPDMELENAGLGN